MTVMSAGWATAPVPDTTVTERCGSQCSTSRRQLSFSEAGQTTTAGYASSASSAASACTVLPRPCSSARNSAARLEHVGDAGALERASSPPSAGLDGERRRVVRARAADVLDRLVVLARAAGQDLAGVGRDLDVVRAQVVLERLEQVGVDGQRAAVGLARGQCEEGGDRLRVPVDVEREARLADALDQRERGRRGLLADLQPRRAAQGALVEARAGISSSSSATSRLNGSQTRPLPSTPARRAPPAACRRSCRARNARPRAPCRRSRARPSRAPRAPATPRPPATPTATRASRARPSRTAPWRRRAAPTTPWPPSRSGGRGSSARHRRCRPGTGTRTPRTRARGG